MVLFLLSFQNYNNGMMIRLMIRMPKSTYAISVINRIVSVAHCNAIKNTNAVAVQRSFVSSVHTPPSIDTIWKSICCSVIKSSMTALMELSTIWSIRFLCFSFFSIYFTWNRSCFNLFSIFILYKYSVVYLIYS